MDYLRGKLLLKLQPRNFTFAFLTFIEGTDNCMTCYGSCRVWLATPKFESTSIILSGQNLQPQAAQKVDTGSQFSTKNHDFDDLFQTLSMGDSGLCPFEFNIMCLQPSKSSIRLLTRSHVQHSKYS